MDLIKEGDKTINKKEDSNDKTPTFKKYDKSNTIYGGKHSSYKYHDIRHLMNFLLNQSIQF